MESFPKKPHYRAVILILASNENAVYRNCRKVWKAYMNRDPLIKVFFVYGKLCGDLEDFDPSSDLVFPDVREGYPLVIEKTLRAMEVIYSQVTYDFFVRTNISTFWDFEKLKLHLDVLPTRNCYSGDGPHPGYSPHGYYLSGTDTIVTPEMIESIVSNQHHVDRTTVEDAAMGKYFHGVLGAPMLPNRICFFEDIRSPGELPKILNRIAEARKNNKDHYRVKTIHGNREEVDLCIYKELLKEIYNIV